MRQIYIQYIQVPSLMKKERPSSRKKAIESLFFI